MRAFVLELCVSTLWLEDKEGNLIEIKHSPALMEDADFRPMTLADTYLYDDQLKKLNEQQRSDAHAANLMFEVFSREQDELAKKTRKPLKVSPGAVSSTATREAIAATGGRATR